MNHLDTHIAVEFAASARQALSSRAAAAIRRSETAISPIVLLEIQYLYERNVTRHSASEVESRLALAGVGVSPESFAEVARKSLEMSWTRDPFDRLIVGHAAAASAHLITKDERILANYPLAVW